MTTSLIFSSLLVVIEFTSIVETQDDVSLQWISGEKVTEDLLLCSFLQILSSVQEGDQSF